MAAVSVLLDHLHDLQASQILLCGIIALPLLFFFILSTLKTTSRTKLLSVPSSPSKLPPSYPILGSIFTISKNKHRRVQWISDIVTSTPTLTFTLHRPFGYRQIFTANATNVEHILKTNFHNYGKGETIRKTLRDFQGDGIFNADGQNWKFQRQVSSHQFNTRSLRQFVDNVVESELSQRLIPILESAARDRTVLDLQDILQRFAFDNVCKIAFGYDPEYLQPSLPEAKFAAIFDSALKLISERFNSDIPMTWKIKKVLGIGSEKQLKIIVNQVREFAKVVVKQKKQELELNKSIQSSSSSSDDLLSRFLRSGYADEEFVTDVVISFILAGRDTTSAALTWFFWMVFNHKNVQKEITKEVNCVNAVSQDNSIYDEVKSMVYTHASLCETMRLYPPVPVSTKCAVNDDVLPDGTVVKRGTRISYHPYAMGRVEKVWGPDWAEFRPERWLECDEGKWRFVGRDPYSYAVFQAGPRTCLGKEMAFLQMKRVAAGVLRRFRVVPVEEGVEPVYVVDFTSKMKGGFMVTVEERLNS